MINFTRAFDSAWERMHIILFRPFDIGKWCVIGFSAFLAGLLRGGNGVNGQYNSNFKSGNWRQNQTGELQKVHDQIMAIFTHWQSGIFAVIFITAFIFGLAFALLLVWLGARGQFLFLDNIARNRGAIVWPWKTYARQGNSLFLFYVVIMLISLVVFLPILIVGVVMAIPLFQQDRWPVGGEIGSFALLGVVYFLLALVINIILFVFREFGVAIMFRQGILARPAFWASINLFKQYPGSIALFVLLRFAIFIGEAIVSVIVCCATCCIGAIPYVGTVILLPVLVYVRCFSLDCLAQFGPEYDIWTVDVPPAGSSGVVPPLSPPPPLG